MPGAKGTKSSPRKGPKKAAKASQKLKTTKKEPKATAADLEVEVADDEATLTQESAKTKIDWTDVDLNSALLNAIWNHTDIKQGLYPSPGGNMSSIKSGGNKKTVWQYRLAVIVFEHHEKYGKSFSYAQNCTDAKLRSKLQSAWGDKIKNRLNRMATITREHMETLGQTGAGIVQASDVDMSQNNAFTNKWAEVIADCPWFLEMRNLIAERPNLVPTGIGNSATLLRDLNLSVLSKDVEADRPGDIEGADEMSDALNTLDGDTSSDGQSAGLAGILHDETAKEIDMLDDDAGDLDVNDKGKGKATSSKRKALLTDDSDGEEKTDIKPDLKTPARPNTSKPATSTIHKKKKSRIEEFSEAAQAEETTRQKEIEYSATKVQASARVKVETVKFQRELALAKLELKKQEREGESEKRRLEHERKVEKMKLKAELKMEQLRLRAGRSAQGASGTGFGNYGAATAHHNYSHGPSNDLVGSTSNMHSNTSHNYTQEQSNSHSNHDQSSEYMGGLEYVPATIDNTFLPSPPGLHSMGL